MNVPDGHLSAIRFALKFVRDEWRSIRMQYTGVEAQAIADANEVALAALAEHAQPQAAGGVVADWSRADEWANFWTRDDTGRALWWETEPYYDERMGIWMCEDDSRRAQATESPILRQRPQAQD